MKLCYNVEIMGVAFVFIFKIKGLRKVEHELNIPKTWFLDCF